MHAAQPQDEYGAEAGEHGEDHRVRGLKKVQHARVHISADFNGLAYSFDVDEIKLEELARERKQEPGCYCNKDCGAESYDDIPGVRHDWPSSMSTRLERSTLDTRT